jgi:hypothetical protein
MVLLSTLVYAAAAVLPAHASPLVQRNAAHKTAAAKAVYFQTNQSPNSIVAIPVNSDGKLGQPVFHASKANGAVEITAKGPSEPDPLSSEDSVVVSCSLCHPRPSCIAQYGCTDKAIRQHLFSVNAGSSKVSLFSIPPDSPTDLALIGTYTMPGDFPVSLAINENLVCVGHAGTRAGVSCAVWTPNGISGFDDLRSFDLHQTNPPNQTLNLLSETYFAADGQVLVANVRGTGASNNTGFLATWAVDCNGVSHHAEVVSPKGTASLFGAAAVPGSSLVFVSDPTFGGTTIDLNHPQTPISRTVVPGQKAICWTRIGVDPSTGILPDAGLNRIVQVELQSGAITQDWNSTNGNSGNFDFALAGDRLYALAYGSTDCNARVAVFDVGGKFSDVQNLVVEGTNMLSTGLAVYT